MLTPLQGFIERYTQKFRGDPNTKLLTVKECWPSVATKYNIDTINTTPIRLTKNTLTLSYSSSEEAAHIRTLQRGLIKDINKKIEQKINRIIFR